MRKLTSWQFLFVGAGQFYEGSKKHWTGEASPYSFFPRLSSDGASQPMQDLGIAFSYWQEQEELQ